MSKWETGQGLPDIVLLPDLAAALGVTVDALLAGEAPEPAGEASEPVPPAASRPEEPALARVPHRLPTRAERDAAVLACRQLPEVRRRRLGLALLGVAGLAAGIGLSVQDFFRRQPHRPAGTGRPGGGAGAAGLCGP